MNSVRTWITTVSGGHERELVTVLGLATIQGFLWAMMIPVIPLLVRELGATEIQLGTIAIVPAIVTIVFSIPGNALGIKYGKKALFIWSEIAGILCGILFLLTERLSLIFLPQILFGISNMLFWPTELAYLTEIIPSHIRARVVGYSMAVSSVGTVFGPTVGGYLIDHAGFKPVFVLYIGMAFLGCLIARALPTLPTNRDSSIVGAVTAGLSGVGTMLKRPMLQITTLNTFFQFINVGITEYFVPVFLKEIGYSATLVGTTVTLRTAGLTLVRFFVGDLASRLGSVPLLFGGLATCALMVGLTPIFPSTGYVMISSFIIGAAFGISPVLTSTVIAENTATSERGLGMALDSTSLNTGRVVCGFAIGGIAQSIGFGSAVIVGNGIVLLGAITAILRYMRLRRQYKKHVVSAVSVDSKD